MKVFLSHAGADAPIARFLKTCFETQLGVRVLMLPDDAPPGFEWIEQIRRLVDECDELLSLASNESINRPWISAEWACFWLKRKPCTPLLLKVRVGQLWGPMQAYQAIDLLNPSLTMLLLGRMAAATATQPQEGLLQLAHSIAEEIPHIRERQERASIGEVLQRITERIEGGSADIASDDVALLVRFERLPELLSLTEAPEASAVKLRQIAVSLAGLGRLGEALRVTLQITNRAEAKNVATYVVRSMDRGLGPESEEWAFLFGVFDHLRAPQRRDVRNEMLKHHIAPLGAWVEAPVLE